MASLLNMSATIKCQHVLNMHPGNIALVDNQAHHGHTPAPVTDNCIINDHDAAENGDEDELEEAGRCKIKIEFI